MLTQALCHRSDKHDVHVARDGSCLSIFPKHNSFRFEQAFVFPRYDGTYEEDKTVPSHRWVSNLPTNY